MVLSQKTQYTLRAILDLAMHYGAGPRRTALIAGAQAIPVRFLEVIMHRLKPVFVDAKRGVDGGYFLVRAPAQITVGEVIRFVQGPVAPVHCMVAAGANAACPLQGACVFLPLWQQAADAMNSVYDDTTFQDLVNREHARTTAAAQTTARTGHKCKPETSP